MENPNNIPEEIVIEIFGRLPLESVGRFRCSSKSWLTTLSTSRFVNSLLIRSNQRDSILLAHPTKLYALRPAPVDALVLRGLDFPNLSVADVLGSCNGLVLVSTIAREIFVLNPLTQQKVHIRNMPRLLNLLSPPRGDKFGFGYDNCSDDYKIVQLSDMRFSGFGIRVGVYSLKNRVWKRVNSMSPYFQGLDYYHRDLKSAVFMNGAIHWLAIDEKNDRQVIVAFHVATESFSAIYIPDENNDDDDDDVKSYRLFGIQGCLFLVDPYDLDDTGSTGYVWIMKSDGQVNSWTKCSTISGPAAQLFYFAQPLCAIGEDEIVFLPKKEDLRNVMVWKLTDRTTKDVKVNSPLPYPILKGCAFVDSLVSPNQCDVDSC